jgi:ribulose kinase
MPAVALIPALHATCRRRPDVTAFVGVDVGSASVRAGVFDRAGTELASAVRPIQVFNPRADVFEQSSADIWEQTGAAVRTTLAPAGVAP